MATGFGVPEIEISPAAEGQPARYQGTEAKDIQVITGAKYINPGILTGATVDLRADWKVSIAQGGVVVDLGSGQYVEVPVYAQVMDLQPAPPTGERVDTIYVEQAVRPDDNSARVVIASGTSAPASAVILDKIRVPAGATKSNACSRAWDRQYARVSQSTQGALSVAVDERGSVRRKGSVYKACSQRFMTETDRWVNLKLSVTAGRTNSSGITSFGTMAASWGSLRYKIYVDNILVRSFEIPISKLWATSQVETMHKVLAGAHTAHITSEWSSDGDDATNTFWVVRWGGAEKSNGDALTVFDAGVNV